MNEKKEITLLGGFICQLTVDEVNRWSEYLLANYGELAAEYYILKNRDSQEAITRLAEIIFKLYRIGKDWYKSLCDRHEAEALRKGNLPKIEHTIDPLKMKPPRTVAEEATPEENKCAAGPWNYDFSQAPRDGQYVLLLKGNTVYCGYDNSGCSWYANCTIFSDSYFDAWAEINMPKVDDK